MDFLLLSLLLFTSSLLYTSISFRASNDNVIHCVEEIHLLVTSDMYISNIYINYCYKNINCVELGPTATKCILESTNITKRNNFLCNFVQYFGTFMSIYVILCNFVYVNFSQFIQIYVILCQFVQVYIKLHKNTQKN